MHRRLLMTGFALVLAALVLTACEAPGPEFGPRFPADVELAGMVVSAGTLNKGREEYILNCYACHGTQGQGDGPAAPGYRPPPRDFTQATFKFGWTVDGMPHDEDLKRIIQGGLHGTPMLDWDLGDETVNAIIQYIKTFDMETWGDPDALGEQIQLSPDPWKGRTAEAVARGEKVYHGFATCQQCHPSYASPADVAVYSKEWNKVAGTRANPNFSEAKPAEFAVAEHPMRIMPPDFTFNPVRVSHDLEEVYKTIGSGIGGTAMPAWKGSLPEEDLWAITYYTKHLIDMKDTADAAILRSKLAASAM
jgi:mono/diheme cytochrome c family protein